MGTTGKAPALQGTYLPVICRQVQAQGCPVQGRCNEGTYERANACQVHGTGIILLSFTNTDEKYSENLWAFSSSVMYSI